MERLNGTRRDQKTITVTVFFFDMTEKEQLFNYGYDCDVGG